MSREVEADRHGDDVGALLDCPQQAVEDLFGGAAPFPVEHFAYEGPSGAWRHSDTQAIGRSAENRARAVCPVAVIVSVALSGEVLLHDGLAMERSMTAVDAAIEHRHRYPSARERAR